MDIADLVNASARAWSLTILKLIAEGTPARAAPLRAASGASRNAFADSLDHLITLGLLERNPGHGHPLRPEFRLTDRGAAMARLARTVLPDPGAGDHRLLRRAWTLPVLSALPDHPGFGQIRARLVPITDRALSQSLKGLEQHQWIARTVDPLARPPRPIYQAIGPGRRIALATQAALLA